ncbi:hypothetical protein [Puia sp.]|jgi:hypothetical protein|uniref:hypothetical protein n=1 Tax=Puia sp. TaxID=2045100 RepID=UPI002F410464
MRKITLPAAFILIVFNCLAQTGGMRMAPGIRLPEDSVTREALMGSLREWMIAKDGPDSLNRCVAVADRPAMAVLTAQMRALKGDCYLGALTPLDSDHWQIRLNYLEMRKDTPMLQACCTLLARREGGHFLMSPPLAENTACWKRKTIGCCTFHYPGTINMRRAAEFERTVASDDRRLGIAEPVIDFYCCANLMEASKLVGIDYLAGYGGYGYSDLSENYGRRMVILCGNEWKDGFSTISMHDIWHGELHRAVSTKIINRPVDEGMAYLYGGSWIAYSWQDILKLIGDYRTAHPGADWLALYKEGTNLIPPPKIIKISYAINALIVQRLERDRGFAASLPLLCCGPKAAGDANYFAALRVVTGVDEPGFNGYIEGLLTEALN